MKNTRGRKVYIPPPKKTLVQRLLEMLLGGGD